MALINRIFSFSTKPTQSLSLFHRSPIHRSTIHRSTINRSTTLHNSILHKKNLRPYTTNPFSDKAINSILTPPNLSTKPNLSELDPAWFQSRSYSTQTKPRIPQELEDKIVQFCKDVGSYLPADGKGVVLTTAWLNTDNVILALLYQIFPGVFRGTQLVAVDTLHLFPETQCLADEIQAKYRKQAIITKPSECNSREDFKKKFGDCDTMNSAEFDYHSKVEPFQRGLELAKKTVTITGRRADQGNSRSSLPIWEEDKSTFNPLANWSWEDITTFVDLYNLPYNKKHDFIYRSEKPISSTERHKTDLQWKEIDLGKPYWRATDVEIRGSPPAPHVYVWKSFGDVHTSVPVLPEQSERAGRFVRTNKTECGIHTRATVSKGQPHGGVLVDLMENNPAKRQSLIDSCQGRVIELDERGACDVELLINGGFSPLRGFMSEVEYNHVIQHMRLPELQLWAIPIVLHTDDENVAVGQNVLLKYKDDLGNESRPLAVLKVESKWQPNKILEALKVLGTTRLDHPGVQELVERGKYYIGGSISGLDFPRRHIECKTPRQVRALLPRDTNVVAFQCRNPVHRAHFELFTRVPDKIPNSIVLVHPTCGPTQDGDIDWRIRFKTYEALQEHMPNPFIKWAYLPYSMHMAGPREAIQHMIIRKNFGATDFIIGRDMAGCKSTITGEDFYGPYDAQLFAEKYQTELGIKVVAFRQMVYTEEKGYIEKDEAEKFKIKALSLSGTEFRRRLKNGEDIPEWFAFPQVVKVLRESKAAN